MCHIFKGQSANGTTRRCRGNRVYLKGATTCFYERVLFVPDVETNTLNTLLVIIIIIIITLFTGHFCTLQINLVGAFSGAYVSASSSSSWT